MKRFNLTVMAWIAKHIRWVVFAMLLIMFWGASQGFNDHGKVWSIVIMIIAIYAIYGLLICLRIRLHARARYLMFQYGGVFAELGERCFQCGSGVLLAGTDNRAVIKNVFGWKKYPMGCFACGHVWDGTYLLKKHEKELLKRGIRIKIKE